MVEAGASLHDGGQVECAGLDRAPQLVSSQLIEIRLRRAREWPASDGDLRGDREVLLGPRLSTANPRREDKQPQVIS